MDPGIVIAVIACVAAALVAIGVWLAIRTPATTAELNVARRDVKLMAATLAILYARALEGRSMADPGLAVIADEIEELTARTGTRVTRVIEGSTDVSKL